MCRESLTSLEAERQAFLLDREAARCTSNTLDHYAYTVGGFVTWLQSLGITSPDAITSEHIRSYLVGLQRRGLKDTTQHAHARGIKTWLRWLEAEGRLERAPRMTMPRLEKRIPAPFTQENVKTLLEACPKTPKGLRDYALLLTLLDSGLRASEFLSVTVGMVDMRSGLITVMGKGRKQRTVRVGARTRKAILRYLATRTDAGPDAPLWVGYGFDYAERGGLTLHGLQVVLHKLGKAAGVMPCSPHRFRRTFALWCLRSGMDLHSLRLLMGHENLDILQRYLALSGEDAERAHKRHSPVDSMEG